MGLSNAERQARWQAKRRAEVEALRKAAAGGPVQDTDQSARAELTKAQAENDRLSKEVERLTRERAREAPPSGTADKVAPDADRKLRGMWMRAELEIEGLRRQLADALRSEPEQVAALRRRIRDLETASARSAAKPKVAKPPLDPESAAARRIASLTTANRNLRSELRTLKQHYEDERRNVGAMSFKAVSLISKALHPDATPTDHDRAEALKAFNGWKSDSNGARRR